jgi:signal transduction histidine kinase
MADRVAVTRLSPLIEEAAAVGGTADLDQLLRSLVAEARRTTGARYAALGVIGDHGVLSDFIYDGITEEKAHQIGPPPTGRGVLGTLIRKRRPLVLEVIGEHPDSVGFPDHHPPMSNFLGVPITAGDESFGNLYLTEKDGGFSEDDLVAVKALSHIAGSGIHSARLQGRLRRLAVVEDRQRIARDLHDSVIQDLFAVGLGLQALSMGVDDAVAARLNSAIDTLDASVATLRRYIFELRETPGPAERLDERVREVVERMSRAYSTRVELTVEEVHHGPWVQDAVLLTTEALSNALRHGRANLIEISLRADEGHQVIEVSDDGAGFDVGQIAMGMGLSSMKARAYATGGWAEIQSQPGTGTRVTARLPIKPEGSQS